MNTRTDDEAVTTSGLTCMCIKTIDINKLPLPPIEPEYSPDKNEVIPMLKATRLVHFISNSSKI
jgi:hypothetical protein